MAELEPNWYRCTECHWTAHTDDWDHVTDPHPLPGQEPDVWVVCADCRSPEQYEILCDDPDCIEPATCGSVHLQRFRWTCFKHCEHGEEGDPGVR